MWPTSTFFYNKTQYGFHKGRRDHHEREMEKHATIIVKKAENADRAMREMQNDAAYFKSLRDKYVESVEQTDVIVVEHKDSQGPKRRRVAAQQS